MSVHLSPYAGSWYSHREAKVEAMLDDAFDKSLDRTGSQVIPRALAVVVPHAAPLYSGPVAAAAYRHIEAVKPDRVIILGFSHAGHAEGVSLPAIDGYGTPLGMVAVDLAAVHDLCSHPPFRLVDEQEVCDHSVEIQLPFLQRACRRAAAIPLFVGRLGDRERLQAAQAIARIARPGDLLIASSDFTHYGRDFHYAPFPIDGRIAERLRELDHRLIEAASSIDSALFLTALRESGGTACGHQPISLLLEILNILYADDVFEQELDYQTSGQITRDYTNSVSYAALGYFRQGSFELTGSEQADLLLRARKAVGFPDAKRPERKALPKRAPVFVTIRDGGRLVGCLGRMDPGVPLGELVPELAASAVGRARLDEPEIEISALTPTRLVRGPEAIRIGLDGALLEMGARRAVLLPQVAGNDWTSETFFDALLRKAGIPPDEHRDAEPRIFTFRAQVFGSN